MGTTHPCKNLYKNIYNNIILQPKKWKQPKCPSSDEWIKKCGLPTIHTMEYYSTVKWNEVLIHSTTLMTLENTAKWKKPVIKHHTVDDSIMYMSIIGKYTETENRLMAAMGRDGGKCPWEQKWEVTANVYSISCGDVKNVLNL